jgi:uncharacterized protein YeaO (DUF488 family)
MELFLKRVYEPKSQQDGMRVLVDRLWPRGLGKQQAAIDLWARDVAPGTELRRWFHAHTDEWPEFRKRYEAELAAGHEALQDLHKAIADKSATLLYAAHVEAERSHAAVLRDALIGKWRGSRRVKTKI